MFVFLRYLYYEYNSSNNNVIIPEDITEIDSDKQVLSLNVWYKNYNNDLYYIHTLL